MDGFDLLILGFMLPVIAVDLHLSSAQAGSLVTWTLIGAVAGGLIFGVLSDYFGRVRMLTWTILIFAVFTGLCALAQGYTDLLVYRTIAGIGLGGEFGIGMTLVAEAWPASQRARVSSYVGLGWQLGVLAAALLTPLAAADDRLARHVRARIAAGRRVVFRAAARGGADVLHTNASRAAMRERSRSSFWSPMHAPRARASASRFCARCRTSATTV